MHSVLRGHTCDQGGRQQWRSCVVCPLWAAVCLCCWGEPSAKKKHKWMLTFSSYSWLLLFQAVMRYYPQVKKAIGASEKIFEYLDRKPQVPPDGTLAPENLQGHIQFKNVTFSYNGKLNEENLVLKVCTNLSCACIILQVKAFLKIYLFHQNISLEVKPGQITALVGLNRSGKSTCVKLLERFYQPIGGEILLDGKPLKSYKDQYLHDKVCEYQIFNSICVFIYNLCA